MKWKEDRYRGHDARYVENQWKWTKDWFSQRRTSSSAPFTGLFLHFQKLVDMDTLSASSILLSTSCFLCRPGPFCSCFLAFCSAFMSLVPLSFVLTSFPCFLFLFPWFCCSFPCASFFCSLFLGFVPFSFLLFFFLRFVVFSFRLLFFGSFVPFSPLSVFFPVSLALLLPPLLFGPFPPEPVSVVLLAPGLGFHLLCTTRNAKS